MLWTNTIMGTTPVEINNTENAEILWTHQKSNYESADEKCSQSNNKFPGPEPDVSFVTNLTARYKERDGSAYKLTNEPIRKQDSNLSIYLNGSCLNTYENMHTYAHVRNFWCLTLTLTLPNPNPL